VGGGPAEHHLADMVHVETFAGCAALSAAVGLSAAWALSSPAEVGSKVDDRCDCADQRVPVRGRGLNVA
jgi:hypothetical protein